MNLGVVNFGLISANLPGRRRERPFTWIALHGPVFRFLINSVMAGRCLAVRIVHQSSAAQPMIAEAKALALLLVSEIASAVIALHGPIGIVPAGWTDAECGCS